MPELLPEQVRLGQAQDEHSRQRHPDNRATAVRLLSEAAHLNLRKENHRFLDKWIHNQALHGSRG